MAATGAAAGTVFAVVASASGGPPRPNATRPNATRPNATRPNTSPASTTPALKLTAAQTALYQLSSAAAGTARPEGRDTLPPNPYRR